MDISSLYLLFNIKFHSLMRDDPDSRILSLRTLRWQTARRLTIIDAPLLMSQQTIYIDRYHKIYCVQPLTSRDLIVFYSLMLHSIS